MSDENTPKAPEVAKPKHKGGRPRKETTKLKPNENLHGKFYKDKSRCLNQIVYQDAPPMKINDAYEFYFYFHNTWFSERRDEIPTPNKNNDALKKIVSLE